MDLENKIKKAMEHEFSYDVSVPSINWTNGTAFVFGISSEDGERVCHTIETVTETTVKWSAISHGEHLEHAFDITDKPLTRQDRLGLGLDVPAREYTADDIVEAINGVQVLEGDVCQS